MGESRGSRSPYLLGLAILVLCIVLAIDMVSIVDYTRDLDYTFYMWGSFLFAIFAGLQEFGLNIYHLAVKAPSHPLFMVPGVGILASYSVTYIFGATPYWGALAATAAGVLVFALLSFEEKLLKGVLRERLHLPTLLVIGVVVSAAFYWALQEYGR